MRALPTFLVIGAMKAGTTSLYHYLRSHPQVHMPKLKEVDFFTEELNWSRGWDWYERHFSDAPPGTVATGEASTSYTKYPRYTGIAERIATALPDVKLIYSVRDPVARIRSHYQHNVTLGEEKDDLETALRRNPAYLDYSRYALQIERYLQHFPREHLLVVTAEALRTERAATVRKVLAFIGADPDVDLPALEQEFYKTQERPAYGPVVTGVRNVLRSLFPEKVGLWRGTFLPEWAKRSLARKAPQRPEQAAVSEGARDLIHRELRADVARVRPFLDDGFDGWGIA